MSAIFGSNTLKSQKSHLYQRKPKNNSPVLLKVTILIHWNYQHVFIAVDGQDGSGLQLEKVEPTFSSCSIVLLNQ